MINKDGGGGQFFDFIRGDTAVMRRDIELMGGGPSPPTRENPEILTTFNWRFTGLFVLVLLIQVETLSMLLLYRNDSILRAAFLALADKPCRK